MIVGNQQEVKEKLKQLAHMYKADELMIVTITHEIEEKLNSYRLIAEAML